MKEQIALSKEEMMKTISPNETSLQAFQPADTHRTAMTIVDDDTSVSMTFDENLSITGDESVSTTDENSIIEASTYKHSMPPQSKWKSPYQQALRGPKLSTIGSKASIRNLKVSVECDKVTSKIKQPITSNFKGKSPYQQSLRPSVKPAMRRKPSASSLKVTDKAVKEVSKSTRPIPIKPKWKSPYEQSLRPSCKPAMRNRMSMPNLQVTSKITDNSLKVVSKNERPILPKPAWESPYKQSLRPIKPTVQSKTCVSNLEAGSKGVHSVVRKICKNKQSIILNSNWESPYKTPLQAPKLSIQNQSRMQNLEITSRVQVPKPFMGKQTSMPNLQVTNRDVREAGKNKESITSSSKWKSPYEQSFGQSVKPANRNQTSMPNIEITSEETDDSISESNNNSFARTSLFKGNASQQTSILALKPAIRIQADMPNVEEIDESITETGKSKPAITPKANWKALLQLLKPAIQTQIEKTDLEVTREEAVENIPSDESTHELQVPKLIVLKPAIRNQTSMPNLEQTNDETITQSHNNKAAITLKSKSVLIAALQPAIRNQTNIPDLEITAKEIDDSVKEHVKNKPAPKSNWKAILQILKPATPSRISTAYLEVNAEETDKNVTETSNNKHPEPSDEIVPQEVKPAIGNLEPNNKNCILITDENFGGKACNNKENKKNRGLSLTTFQQVSVASTTSSEAINKTDIKTAKEENYNKIVVKPLHNNEAEIDISKQISMTSNVKSSAKSAATIKKEMSPKVVLVAESDKAKFKGNAYIAGGQYQKAIAEYSRAIELNPNSAACFYRRAVAYNFLDMHAQCIIDSEKVRELDPKYGKVYGLLGMTYAHLGLLQQAHQALTQALMFEPMNEIYRGSFQTLHQMLYQPELEKARVHEVCYFTDRYEQFKKDPDILNAALPLLKEPSAYNITSTLLLNKHVEQQSNVINTLKYLQEHNKIIVPVHEIPLKHQIEKYSKQEQKKYLFLVKEEKTTNTVPKIGTSPNANISPKTNAMSNRPKDLIDLLIMYKEKKEKDKNGKQKLHK